MAGDQYSASMVHADGARMTYDVLGTQYLGKRIPIVLIGGMSSLKGDWERLANALADIRPVLLFDHRGMGDSTYSSSGDEEITIELYARDVLDLLTLLQWEQVAICGFSMGGAVTQQLLLLPYHRTAPTPLPFRVTHAFLTGTLAAPFRDRRYGLKLQLPPPPPGGRKRTREERKEIARPTLESTFDEAWLRDPTNQERFEVLLERMVTGRPTKTILQQARALNRPQFNAPHSAIPSTIPILVVHGQNDLVVPFTCSLDILSLIPHAKAVTVGPAQGQVPDLNFGHQWYEYFDIKVWVGVIEEFTNNEKEVKVKL